MSFARDRGPTAHDWQAPKRVPIWNARLLRVEAYVLANPEARLSFAQAAALARLHPKYFSAYFKRQLGISFSSWLRKVRAGRALLLLRDTDLPVEVIAASAGFFDAFGANARFQEICRELVEFFRTFDEN